MKKFITSCDMGSIKIFSSTFSYFFMNDIGDGINKVYIKTRKSKKFNRGKFLGHFTVKEKNKVFLSKSDCMDVSIFTFPKGRFFVYLKGLSTFEIEFMDNDLHG